MRNEMKKYAIIVTLGILMGSMTLFGYCFLGTTGHKYLGASAQQNDHPAQQEKSFQGKLADVLSDIMQNNTNTQKAFDETTRNPFTDQISAQNEKENRAPDSASFTFAVLGDTQNFYPKNPHGYFQQVAALVEKMKPDLAFSVGDLVGKCTGNKSCEKDFKYWKSILGDFASKTYVAQGNHDRTGGAEADKAWQSAFDFPKNGPPKYSEITYSFDFKNTHFIVLASDKPEIHLVNGEQRAWLEKDLAENKKENTFVFFHEPAYPVYDIAGESLDNHPGERNGLWEILDRYNVTGVFNGHEHIITRRKIDSSVFPGAKNSVYQFVFGNTDSFDQALPKPGIAEFTDQGQGRFGFVKVSGKNITIETHGPDGSTLDSSTYSK
jgi:3',5'-cyclic-AMP phosphodiesterase